MKSASVPEVDDAHLRDNRSGDRHVLGERLGLIREHVGPRRREPLILDHPEKALRRALLGRERYRMRGVVDVAVVRRGIFGGGAKESLPPACR